MRNRRARRHAQYAQRTQNRAPAALRADRPAAAGRRRARLLPGRRLSGAGRGRTSIPTGSPASRSARSTARSSPAMRPSGASSGCATSGRRSPRRRIGIRAACIRALDMPDDTIAPLRQPDARARHRAVGRRAGLLHAAAAAAVPSCRPAEAERHELLRHRAAARRRSSSWSTSTASMRGEMRFSVGAVNVRTGNFVYFDNEHAPDRARARHGQRLAAAGLSGDRDRRRVLLGRRPRLQHAAAMGARQPRRGATRWPSRSTCGARAASCRATWPRPTSRQKEIHYSSRTRAGTDQFKQLQKLRRRRARSCSSSCPSELRDTPRT